MSTTRHKSVAKGDPTAPKVHVVTFGCQMNKYDSSLVEGRFLKAGYATTDSPDDADVMLFNTCSVRDHAEERTWSWVGELKKVKQERPDMVIGVDEVRAKRLDPLAKADGMRMLSTDMTEDVVVDRAGETYTGGMHAFLAVMRGCDLNCTYCIVPTTRGRVRSRSIDELETEAKWLVDQGVQVITLLGQTINSYGEDFPAPTGGESKFSGRQGRPGLGDLLRRLQESEGLVRIRLITLHPSYVTVPFAEAIRDCPKVDRFLPLPAQAGTDDLLKRMKRGYTLDLYRKRADILRETVPGIELGSDWIVGFCGETDADHAGSEAFLQEQGFVVNYIYKYDPRPGTKADGLEDDVPEDLKKARHRALLDIAEKVQRERLKAYVGTTVEALIESVSGRDPRMLLGRTIFGMPFSVKGDADQVGKVRRVTIDEASAYGMGATLV